MKKSTSIMLFVITVITSLSLTSCDEDQQIAMALQDVTFEGRLYSSDYDYYSSRWDYRYGSQSRTVIHFDGNLGSRHGEGWEIDYDGPRRYGIYRNYFRWEVRDAVIILRYADGYEGRIYRYDLADDGSEFRGEIEYNNGDYASFVLFGTSNGYNYYDGYFHGYAKKNDLGGSLKD